MAFLIQKLKQSLNKMNVPRVIIASLLRSSVLRTLMAATKKLNNRLHYSSNSSYSTNVANYSEDINLKSVYFSPGRNLSEKEKKIPFSNYHDPNFVSGLFKAQKLLKQYNEHPDIDIEGRRKILAELLNPACRNREMIIIDQPFQISFGYNLTVGDRFYSNIDCYFEDTAPITIGDNCLLAPGVSIYTRMPTGGKDRRDYTIASPVTVGNDVWIGGCSVICPGVSIGNNVIVGSGSLVTKDVPSNVLVAGNPAEIVRFFDIK